MRYIGHRDMRGDGLRCFSSLGRHFGRLVSPLFRFRGCVGLFADVHPIAAVIMSAYLWDFRPELLLPFSAVSLAILMAWFGWTLSVSAKMAKARGHPWTQPLVLKKVSMGRIVREHEWHSDSMGMGKVSSGSRESDIEVAKPV